MCGCVCGCVCVCVWLVCGAGGVPLCTSAGVSPREERLNGEVSLAQASRVRGGGGWRLGCLRCRDVAVASMLVPCAWGVHVSSIHAAAEKTLSSLANLHQVQDKISGMEDDALVRACALLWSPSPQGPMSLTPRGVVSLDTATATQIMDAYQVGLQAMRVTKAELGLDADTVAEIVDEVGAEIDEAKAVSDSLAQGACLWQWWWWWWWCDGSTATLTCGLGSTQTCRYSKPARTSFWTN